LTVRDVAARAGVSPMTVSRTLAGGKNVRPELQQRVWAAARDLGYHRNENARSLRPGQPSGLIGIAITNLGNPYYGEFAIGVEEVAAQHGRRILLGNSDEDQARERQLVADFVGRQVEGLIVVPAAGAKASHLSRAELEGRPLVLASRLVDDVWADVVVLDDVNGAYQGAKHLIAAGHRRIGYLGNVASVSTGQRRFDGFCRAMAEAGLAVEPGYVARQQQTAASASAAMEQLLRLPQPPTAVFAANNRNTIGALTAIARHLDGGAGWGPSVVSFDTFDLAELSPVPLTLIAHDARALGRKAAELLFDRADKGPDHPPVLQTIPVSLRVVRPEPPGRIEGAGPAT
jgi:LacI family transcriptional regulator